MKKTTEAYRNQEKKRAVKLIKNGWFNGDPGDGKFDDIKYSFVLENSENNFYQPVVKHAREYFKNNNIAWWKGDEPTGHTLSSQIACLNHLFPIRNDREAVLSLLHSFTRDFTDVMPITTDK